MKSHGQEAEEAGDEIVADASDVGEEEAAEMPSPAATSTGGAQQTPQLGELLQTGARFLMELGQALTPQPPSGETGAGSAGGDKPRNPLASMVSVDGATGKSCLKIPLPEPEVMNSIVSGLSQLLAGFMGGGSKGSGRM